MSGVIRWGGVRHAWTMVWPVVHSGHGAETKQQTRGTWAKCVPPDRLVFSTKPVALRLMKLTHTQHWAGRGAQGWAVRVAAAQTVPTATSSCSCAMTETATELPSSVRRSQKSKPTLGRRDSPRATCRSLDGSRPSAIGCSSPGKSAHSWRHCTRSSGSELPEWFSLTVSRVLMPINRK